MSSRTSSRGGRSHERSDPQAGGTNPGEAEDRYPDRCGTALACARGVGRRRGDPGGPLVVRCVASKLAKPSAPSDNAYTEAKTAIRIHLAAHPDEHGADVLAEKIGRRKTTVRTAVQEMLSEGEIVNHGSRNRPRLRLGGGP